MTTSAPLITFDFSSDAGFQASCLAVSNALKAVGLVKTADTGQQDWTAGTQTRAGSNAGAYFEIFRFYDALQASKPVFIKMIYGNGAGSNSISVQIGNGTNGAGTITGVSTAVRQLGTYASLTYAVPCFFSSDGSYLTMALGAGQPAGVYFAVLAVDRTRDADGTANADGVYCFGTGPGVIPSVCTIFWTSGMPTKAWIAGSNASFPADAPGGQTTGIWGTEISVYPHPVYAPKVEAGPASAVLGIVCTDLMVGTIFSVVHLGGTHTYMTMGGFLNGAGWAISYNGMQGVGTHGVAIRYE